MLSHQNLNFFGRTQANIPKEMIELILSALPSADLIKVTSVSSQWKNTIRTNTELWKRCVAYIYMKNFCQQNKLDFRMIKNILPCQGNDLLKKIQENIITSKKLLFSPYLNNGRYDVLINSMRAQEIELKKITLTQESKSDFENINILIMFPETVQQLDEMQKTVKDNNLQCLLFAARPDYKCQWSLDGLKDELAKRKELNVASVIDSVDGKNRVYDENWGRKFCSHIITILTKLIELNTTLAKINEKPQDFSDEIKEILSEARAPRTKNRCCIIS